MAKFYGKVGFLRNEETAPDVYGEILTERLYKGDVIRNQKRYQSSEGLNDDVVLSNNIHPQKWQIMLCRAWCARGKSNPEHPD